MKKLIFLGILVLSFSSFGQTLTRKWRTDTLLRVPESVLWDESNKVLYVACIDGKPDGKDGVGSIGKVSAKGKIINPAWVKGLNAPKGMGLFHNTLYVADVDQVDVIDIKTGKITARIPMEGSKFLNDITVDTKGDVYISDTGIGRIYQLHNNKPEVYFESTEFKGINGLLSIKEGLYIVDFGTGFSYILTPDKKLSKVGETGKGADGVVPVGKNEYLVSIWGGEIYFVNAAGKATKLVDTKDQKLSSADIWFDAKTNVLYVPTFYSNSVIAYSFKK